MVHVAHGRHGRQDAERAETWGVVVKDGLAYVNDNNNGLWIVRIEPKKPQCRSIALLSFRTPARAFGAALGMTAVARVSGWRAETRPRLHRPRRIRGRRPHHARSRSDLNGARKVEGTTKVGINPMDPDGPHGVALAPDGKTYYVTTAHGIPYGYLWKLDAKTNEVVGSVELGNFPATLQVTPDGGFVYVVNFNLHGEMVPSSVSVVSTDPFIEVARIQTCTMPHGSRLNAAGTKQYSACMMDDMLVEIDTRELQCVAALHARRREPSTAKPARRIDTRQRRHGRRGGTAGTAWKRRKPGDVSCSPTWAQPSADGRSVFVACNKTNDIVEIDATSWTMKRRIPAGDGVYNLAVTRDGKLLVATNKRGKSVSIIDIASGKELATIPTQRRVVHGVVDLAGRSLRVHLGRGHGLGARHGRDDRPAIECSASPAQTSARWPEASTF